MSIHFSIVIPTHNRPEELTRAIKSIFNQGYVEFTIFVIDDCSSESYLNPISLWNDARIKYRKLSFNQGVAAARNEAIKEISSDWIFFLDDDDELCDGYLHELNKVISNFPDAKRCFVWGGIHQVFYGLSGRKLLDRERPQPKCSDIRLDALQIGLSYGVAIPKAIFTECGLFDTNYRMGEDTEFIIRMLSAGIEPVYVPFTGVRKHEHRGRRLAGDFSAYAKNNIYSSIIDKHWDFFKDNHSLHANFGSFAASNYYRFGMTRLGNRIRNKMFFAIPTSVKLIKLLASLFIYAKKNQLLNLLDRLRIKNLRRIYRQKMRDVISNNNFAIISEDGWAEEHYTSLNISANTPTIRSSIHPNDYLKFIKDVLSGKLKIVDAKEENGDTVIKTPSSTIRYSNTDLNTAILIFNRGVEIVQDSKLFIKIDFGKNGYAQNHIDEWNSLSFGSSIAFVPIGSPFEKYPIWNKASVVWWSHNAREFFHASSSMLIDKLSKLAHL